MCPAPQSLASEKADWPSMHLLIAFTMYAVSDIACAWLGVFKTVLEFQ